MRQLKPKFLPRLRFVVMSRPANERHYDQVNTGSGYILPCREWGCSVCRHPANRFRSTVSRQETLQCELYSERDKGTLVKC